MLTVAFGLTGCSAAPTDPAPSPTETAAASPSAEGLLLFTSLPIFWSEGSLSDMLSDSAEPHWARKALEARWRLVPVDSLTALRDRPEAHVLLMAQPRALAGGENVTLDNFVRNGGRVVMIVDPMLEAHSAYGFGDKRRPEAVSMLSPILARWGLRLVEDERPAYVAQWGQRSVPVEDGGLFELTGTGFESSCHLVGDGLAAWCRVGKGKVVLMADATFIADGEKAGGDGDKLLLDLIDEAQAPIPAEPERASAG